MCRKLEKFSVNLENFSLEQQMFAIPNAAHKYQPKNVTTVLIHFLQMSVQEYELLKEEDEGCLKSYRKRCMQEMHDKLSFGPRFEGVYDLDSGEAFLEVIEKEDHSTVVVVHIYKNGIKGCEALNSCLDCLATEYPTVKFCKIDAVASGAAERFSDEYLPTLLVYKAGELLGNFLSCTQHLNEEFFATDVEGFLNSYGLLPEKEQPQVEDDEENNIE